MKNNSLETDPDNFETLRCEVKRPFKISGELRGGQWLELRTLIAVRARGSIPGQGIRILQATKDGAAKKKKRKEKIIKSMERKII